MNNKMFHQRKIVFVDRSNDDILTPPRKKCRISPGDESFKKRTKEWPHIDGIEYLRESTINSLVAATQLTFGPFEKTHRITQKFEMKYFPRCNSLKEYITKFDDIKQKLHDKLLSKLCLSHSHSFERHEGKSFSEYLLKLLDSLSPANPSSDTTLKINIENTPILSPKIIPRPSSFPFGNGSSSLKSSTTVALSDTGNSKKATRLLSTAVIDISEEDSTDVEFIDLISPEKQSSSTELILIQSPPDDEIQAIEPEVNTLEIRDANSTRTVNVIDSISSPPKTSSPSDVSEANSPRECISIDLSSPLKKSPNVPSSLLTMVPLPAPPPQPEILPLPALLLPPKKLTLTPRKPAILSLLSLPRVVSEPVKHVAALTTEKVQSLPTDNELSVYIPPSQFPQTNANLITTLINPFWYQMLDEAGPQTFDKKSRILFEELRKHKKKLESGEFCDLWMFLNDVLGSIDNIRKSLRRGKGSDIYCLKIQAIFETNMERIIKNLGYCCGKRRIFIPSPLNCDGKKGCLIREGAVYHCFESEIPYCDNCFDKFPDELSITDFKEDKTIVESIIRKSWFCPRTHESTSERLVRCTSCGRKNHVICERYLEEPEGPDGEIVNNFICSKCRVTEEKDKFRAKDLPTTRLSTFIENRVTNYLKKNGLKMTIHIRAVAATKKSTIVQEQPKTLKHWKKLPPDLPYTKKVVFAFLEIDGVDVWIFGFHAHEYGKECPHPNRGHIYLANMDSFRYIEPKKVRTAIYQEILLGYFAYANQIGFKYIHVCVSPLPPSDTDCLIHAHPPEQKIPDFVRLEKWYLALFKKGKLEGTVSKFEDIIESISMNPIPYIGESPLPKLIEELVGKDLDGKFLNAELEERLKTWKMTPGKKFGESERWRQNQAKRNLAANSRVTDYYVVYLNNKNRLHDDEDLDRILLCSCKSLEDCEEFVWWCIEFKHEFSTVRRAKYTSLIMLNLITQAQAESQKRGNLRHMFEVD